MYNRKYPWTFVKNYIDEKLMEEHTGNKKTPGLTAESWVEHEDSSAKNHPILFKISEMLSDAEIKFDRFIEMFRKPGYYYNNAIRDKTHMLPTGLKKGQWHDMSYRLFHGIMESNVWFVEHEGKEGIRYYLEAKEKNEISEYPEHQKNCYETVLAVKKWYQEELPRHEKNIDVFQSLAYKQHCEASKGSIMRMLSSDKTPVETNERRRLYNEASKIELLMEKEKKENMKKIIDVHESMWS